MIALTSMLLFSGLAIYSGDKNSKWISAVGVAITIIILI